VNIADVMQLMTVMGNIAGLVLAAASIQILVVNSRLLPKPVRPGWVPKLFLLACCLFYSGFFVVVVWDRFIRL
jgi:hypothetical protein